MGMPEFFSREEDTTIDYESYPDNVPGQLPAIHVDRVNNVNMNYEREVDQIPFILGTPGPITLRGRGNEVYRVTVGINGDGLEDI